MVKYAYYQLLINQNPVRKLDPTIECDGYISSERIFYFVSMRQFTGYPFRNYLANQIHLKKIITNCPIPFVNLIRERKQTEIYELFSKQTIQMLSYMCNRI